MDYPPNSTVLYYLQRVESFLESERKSQIFPDISKGLQEILKEVVRDMALLNVPGYDDDVKTLAAKILSIIKSNMNVFKLKCELQSGEHGKDVFMYRKVVLNEVKATVPLRKPSEYQTPLTDITESTISSKFKLQCLNATVKFVKDDTQFVLNYPEMATEQADFVMDMLSQGNKVATEDTDVGFGYKCLYAALWESMKIFSLKYTFKIDYVKPKHADMKQVVFQKIPKLQSTEDSGNLFSKSTPSLTRKVTEVPHTLSENSLTTNKFASKIVISTSDNVASNSDNLASNISKLTIKSDNSASNFDKIVPNSKTLASNSDKIVSNSKNFASNSDKIVSKSDNSALTNQTLPKFDDWDSYSVNWASYSDNWATNPANWGASSKNFASTSSNRIPNNSTTQIKTLPTNKTVKNKAVKLTKTVGQALENLNANFVSESLVKIKKFCFTESEASLQFLSMDHHQCALLTKIKDLSKTTASYMLFVSEDQKILEDIRYWFSNVGKYKLEMTANKVKGLTDIVFVKSPVFKKSKVQGRLQVCSDSDVEMTQDSETEQVENKILSRNVTMKKKTRKNITKIIEELDTTFIHNSLRKIHNFLTESTETMLVINRLAFAEARFLILLHKVVNSTVDYQLFEIKSVDLLGAIQKWLEKEAYMAEVAMYYDKDDDCDFRRIKFTKLGPRVTKAEKENDPPKITSNPKPLAPVTVPVKVPVNAPVKTKSGIKAKMIEALSQPVQCDKAMKMMLGMGWTGGALGVRGEGILEPIAPDLDVANRAGLGHVKQPKDKASKAKVSKEKVPETKVSKENVPQAKVSNAKVSQYLPPEFLPVASVSKSTKAQQHLRALERMLELITNDIDSIIVDYPLPEILTRKEYNFVMEIVKNVNSKKYMVLDECQQKQLSLAIAEQYGSIQGLRLGLNILDPQTIQIEKLSITKFSQNLQTTEKLSKTGQDLAFSCIILAEILTFCQSEATSKTVDVKQVLDLKKMECIKNVLNTLNSDRKVFGTSYYVNIVGDIRREMVGVNLKCSFDGLNTTFRLQKTFKNVADTMPVTKMPKDLSINNNFVAENKNISITSKTDANTHKNDKTNDIPNTLNKKQSVNKENAISEEANTCNTDPNCKKSYTTGDTDINQNIKKEINHEGYQIVEDSKTGNPVQNRKSCETVNNFVKSKINNNIEGIAENNEKFNQTDKDIAKNCDKKEKIHKNSDTICLKCIENLDKSEINLEISQIVKSVVDKTQEIKHTETPKVDKDIQVNLGNYNAQSSNTLLKKSIAIDNSNDAKNIENEKEMDSEIDNIEDVRKRLHSPFKKEYPKKFKALSDFKTIYILPVHSNERLDKEKAREIQALVLQTIDYTRENLPRLDCKGIQNGALIYSCQDEKSLFFIENVIKKMADLKIVYESDHLPKKSRKMTFRMNSFLEEDTVKILQRLELYNKELCTKNWVIIKKEQYSDFIVICVEIDDNSFDYVCDANFILFVGNDCARFSVVWE